MLWVDQESYFGPDRRRRRRLRLLERRRVNYAGPPPSLNTALRKLRLRVLDAQGAGTDAVICYTLGLSQLAQLNDEPDTAVALARLAAVAEKGRARERDVQTILYDGLDQVETTLRVHHAVSAKSAARTVH